MILDAPATITEPGLYRMDDAQYFADPAPGGSLSQSRAKVLLAEGGPAKLRYALDHEETSTEAFDFGKAVHAALLGAGSEYTVLPSNDLRHRETKAAADEAEESGLIALRPRDHTRLVAMVDAVAAHPLARDLLELPGEPEVAAFDLDPATGVWLRGKLDKLAESCVVDYKTSADASPTSWARAALRYGYPVQDAMYRRLSGRDRMFFVVQDKEPPYLVAVVELDDAFRALGERDLRRAIDLYAACREADTWPGYGDDLITLTPPAWALRDLDAETDDEYDARTEADMAAFLHAIA